MQQRALGSRGPVVSALGLGTFLYGDHDDAAVEATISAALDLGITLIGTADVYGAGHLEELIGRAIQGRREQVVLASKGGAVLAPDGSFAGVDGSPEFLQAACKASLHRLGVDHLDLYLLHRVDPGVPIEETVGAMADLVGAGLVRGIGLSEVGPSLLRRACAVHPLVALESELSLLTREVQATVLPTCRELGIGLLAYSPLSRGLLTGSLRSRDADLAADDHRRAFPRFSEGNLAQNVALVDRIAEIAAEHGCTPGQLALAWVLAVGEDVVPLVGTGRRAHLEENLDALDVVLTTGDLDRLDALLPPGSAAGHRYHPGGARRLDPEVL